MKKIKIYSLSLVCLLSIFLSSCKFEIPSTSQNSDSLSNSTSNSGESSSSSESSIISEEPSNSSSDEISSPSTSVEESPSVDSPSLISSNEYNELFNQNSDINISITMSNEAMQKLEEFGSNRDYLTYSDIYWPATFVLTMNGKEYAYDEIGIRLKGNTSRNTFISDYGYFENYVHFKISFNETFDDVEYVSGIAKDFYHNWTSNPSGKEDRKDRTLFDMEGIDLKWNKTYDETHSRQAYSYSSYKKLGLYSPNDNLVNFTLTNLLTGDKMSGVYELIENIDKIFIKRNLPSKKAGGDLYKCTYGQMGKADFTSENTYSYSSTNKTATIISGGKVGIEVERNNYHPSYDLKTNKKTSTHSAIANFFAKINLKSSDQDEVKTSLESAIDMDYFLRFSAISTLLSNPDDQRLNANNFYLYFCKDNQKAIWIPYDYDWSLGNYWENCPDVTYFDPFGLSEIYANSHNVLYYRTMNNSGGSSTYRSNYPLIKEYQTSYANYVKSYKTTILSDNAFQSYVNKFKTNDTTGKSISYYMNAKMDSVNYFLSTYGY